jgi:hypothetical protein
MFAQKKSVDRARKKSPILAGAMYAESGAERTLEWEIDRFMRRRRRLVGMPNGTGEKNRGRAPEQ